MVIVLIMPSAAMARLTATDVMNASPVGADASVGPSMVGGGSAGCPVSQLPVDGSTYWSDGVTTITAPGLRSSSFGTRGNGTEALGFNGSASSRHLRADSRCVNKDLLSHATSATHSASAEPGAATEVELACPDGARVFGGGAAWHKRGEAPAATDATSAWISSSSPRDDGRSWYANGFNDSANSLKLTVTVLCAPRSQLDGYTVVEGSAMVANATLGTAASCPPGSRVITGGMLWSKPGEGPKPSLASSTRVMNSYDTGANTRAANGENTSAKTLKLKATTVCLDPA